MGQDGKRYGLPKDWDTIGLFYNKAMLASAGVTEEQMKDLTGTRKTAAATRRSSPT